MNIGETSTRGQRADPVRGVNRSVAAVVVPGLARSERPRVGLRRGLGGRGRLPRAPRAPCGSRGQTRCAACARAGPALSAPSTVTSAASSPCAIRSVCSTSASDAEPAPRSRAAAVDLDRDQDLVLLGDLAWSRRSARGRTRSSPCRAAGRPDRAPTAATAPARRPGPGRCARSTGAGARDVPAAPGEHQPPPRQPALLRLGIEQRERDHAARQHRGQAPPALLADHADRAVAVAGLRDRHAAQLARNLRSRLRRSSGAPGPSARRRTVRASAAASETGCGAAVA